MTDHRIGAAFACEACGTVNDLARERIAMLERQVAVLEEDVQLAEKDLRGKRAEKKRLLKEREKAMRQDPVYDKAVEVLEHWKAVCQPTAREPLSPKRLEPCLARLHAGYAPAELKRACDGYALKPFVLAGGRRWHEGPKDAWQADAELIFRDAKHVDQGLRIADRADDLRQAMSANGDQATVDDTTLGPSAAGETFVGSPLGLAALKAARHDIFVFPCKPGEKLPATSNGFKAATTDEAKIRLAWSRADYNIGVACGKSGLLVVDVDGDEGFESLHALMDEAGVDEMPDTLSVKTPGGGQHYYFQAPPASTLQNTQSILGEAIDTRGVDGYVLMPPSVGSAGRTYEVDDAFPILPLPDWIKTRLVDYEVKKAKVGKDGKDWAKEIQNPPKQGTRNSVMTSYVGHLYAVGMNPREVMATARLLAVQAKPPMADKELHKIVESIARAEARKS